MTAHKRLSCNREPRFDVPILTKEGRGLTELFACGETKEEVTKSSSRNEAEKLAAVLLGTHLGRKGPMEDLFAAHEPASILSLG
jgi:hypothetical protein